MKTVRELSALIGTQVMMEPTKGLQFRCRVINVKTAYGRPCVQIQAIDGQGHAWVNLETVTPCEKEGGRRAL
jgi:hypothetical protein